MTDTAKQDIARAASAVFEPLVRLFADMGLTSPEAEQLLRTVYVQQAQAVERARLGTGADVPVTQIALRTGLHRNVVSQILKQPPVVGSRSGATRHRAVRALRGWHRDPEYLTADGEPRVLALRTSNARRPSFWTLAEKHAPGVWPGTLLRELVRIRAVRKTDDGRYEVRKEAHRAPAARADALDDMAERSRDLLSTLLFNIQNPPNKRRIVDTVVSDYVTPERAKVLRRILAERVAALVSSLQHNFDFRPAGAANLEDLGTRVGLTLYSFESETAEAMERHGASEAWVECDRQSMNS